MTTMGYRMHDMEKVEAALKTGAPAFVADLPPNKCPNCGKGFKPSKYRAQKFCSLSCSAQSRNRRRKA